MDEMITEKKKKKKKGGFAKGFLAGIFCMLLVFLAGALFFVSANRKYLTGFSKVESYEVGSKETEEKIKKIKSIVDLHFLNEIDEEKLVDGMYKGMMSGLEDPYSVYYNEQELKDMMESSEGRYAGIGAQMQQNMTTGIVTIVKPFDNSPAIKAGLQSGDILAAVNGEDITGKDLSTIVAHIKGEPGTDVTLTIIRKEEELDITVTRDMIEVQTVTSKMIDESIGYISVVEFDSVTTEQFKQHIQALQESGMQSLIIDLRNNPGGNLAVVVEMLDYILPEGMLVYTEDKYGDRNEIHADDKDVLDIPMTVLINENSASASEIFAGAVKDYEWATLVGTKTFGKGIVQQIIDLGDGTAIKITISKYFTPKGNDIHTIGISPDIEVELPEDAYEEGVLLEEKETQLQKAIEGLKTENGVEN